MEIPPKQAGLDYIGVAVVFFCFDRRGRILMQLRSDKCRDEQRRWDCGGGAIEPFELPQAAVRRELAEEYGITFLRDHPAAPHSRRAVQYVTMSNVVRPPSEDQPGSHWICLLYRVDLPYGSGYNAEPEKILEVGWFDPRELPEPRHTMFDYHLNLVRTARAHDEHHQTFPSRPRRAASPT